jgi:hypothetical protein
MLGTMEHKFSIFDENVPSVIENENAKKKEKEKKDIFKFQRSIIKYVQD